MLRASRRVFSTAASPAAADASAGVTAAVRKALLANPGGIRRQELQEAVGDAARSGRHLRQVLTRLRKNGEVVATRRTVKAAEDSEEPPAVEYLFRMRAKFAAAAAAGAPAEASR